ncbi:MAG: sugar ABC transporter substrate-binding protein [Chloroflexi bacterium]|nr:sugar ABC transporter substrate-binding protein [Chloroflexota bacterium]
MHAQYLTSRRALLRLIVMGAGGVLLTGCGHAAGSSAAAASSSRGTAQAASTSAEGHTTTSIVAPATSGTTAPAKLRMIWYSAADLPLKKKMIAIYHQHVPSTQVTVDLVPFAQYWTKLETMMASGTGYDVELMNGPNFLINATRHGILDLSSYVAASKLNVDQFPRWLRTLYTYQGHLYGLPERQATIALFYNKSLFDAIGVKTPDNTWTWQTYLDAAQKLTKTGSNGAPVQYGTVSSADDAQEDWFNWVFQNKGHVLDAKKQHLLLDQPAAIQAIQYLVDLVQKYKVAPLPSTMAQQSETQLFMAGKLAMMPGGPWNVGIFEPIKHFQWDIAPLPKGKQRACVIHGSAYCIGATTKYPEQTFQFIDWMATSKTANKMMVSDITPGTTWGAKEWAAATPPSNRKVFSDAIAYSHEYPATLYTNEWMDKVTKQLDLAWLGKQSVQTACQAATQQANAVLATEAAALKGH